MTDLEAGGGPKPARSIALAVPEATAEALVRGCALHNGVRLRRGLRPLSIAEYLLGCMVTGQEAKLTEDRAWVQAAQHRVTPAAGESAPPADGQAQ